MRIWSGCALRALLEARPPVIAIFVLRYLAGVLLASVAHRVSVDRVVLGAFGWACVTVAIYLYNGITDRREDVVNGSNRPIADGTLPVRFAACFALTAAVAGLLCAAALGAAEACAALVLLALGQIYSGPPFRLKRRFYAASLVGGSGGLITYAAGALGAGGEIGIRLVVFGGAMSLWMGLVGGIAKDLPDEPGDRAAGRRTWPVVFGARKARALMRAAAALVGAGFATAAALWSAGLLWCALVVALGAGGVIVAAQGSQCADLRERSGRPYRAFMWTQHLSHLVLVGTLGLGRSAWR